MMELVEFLYKYFVTFIIPRNIKLFGKLVQICVSLDFTFHKKCLLQMLHIKRIKLNEIPIIVYDP